MKTISLKLAEGLDQKLAATAKKQRTTKSNLLRLAIQAFLSDDPKNQAGSCLDLARDLVGCVDAPADLSSNPARLKGFGK